MSRKIFRLLVIVLLFGCTTSCGFFGQGEKSLYGVPSGVNLDVPCPANGTWNAYNTKQAFTTPPTLSVEKVVIKNWLVEIQPVSWENTYVCTYVLGVQVCDYKPQKTNYVIRGYIDPASGTPDSNGNTRYSGKTKDGQQMYFWDYTAPNKVYLNIDFFKNNKWSKAILYP